VANIFSSVPSKAIAIVAATLAIIAILMALMLVVRSNSLRPLAIGAGTIVVMSVVGLLAVTIFDKWSELDGSAKVSAAAACVTAVSMLATALGVVTAFWFNARTTEREESRVSLEYASSQVQAAYDLFVSEKDRVEINGQKYPSPRYDHWNAVADMLTNAQLLGHEIKYPPMRRSFDLQISDLRRKFTDALMIEHWAPPPYGLPEAYFAYGRGPNDLLGGRGMPPPIEERALAVIHKFAVPGSFSTDEPRFTRSDVKNGMYLMLGLQAMVYAYHPEYRDPDPAMPAQAASN
jgi:hypothetical protein